MPHPKRSTLQPRMPELYSTLGYSKILSPERHKLLYADIHAFFTAYERNVSALGSRDLLSDEIKLCASEFLVEESRGELYWGKSPPAGNYNGPTWPAEEPLISETVAHILRRKAKSTSVGRSIARSRARRADMASDTESPAKSCKKRQRDEGSTDTSSKLCYEFGEDSESQFYLQYIRSLSPKVGAGKVTGFNKSWLKTTNIIWPDLADGKLQTFMHNRKYYAFHYGPGSELVNILKKGSDIEILENGLLYDEFKKRIRDRIKFLAHRLATDVPYPVLELKDSGNVQMTRRFALMWGRKEECWNSIDLFPPQDLAVASSKKQYLSKQRKTSGSKEKSPVAFPNLSTSKIAIPQKSRLVSLAGLALLTATHGSEDEWSLTLADQQDEMVTLDASAVMSTRNRNRSRSASTEDSIVVDSLRRMTKEAPRTFQSRPSIGSLSRYAQVQDRDGTNGQGAASSAIRPPTFVSSKNHANAHNSTRPESSSDLEMQIPSFGHNSGQFMVIDEKGNASFSKTEPVPDTTRCAPMETTQQQPVQPRSRSNRQAALDGRTRAPDPQLLSINERISHPLSESYPPRSILPPRPSWGTVADLGHNKTYPFVNTKSIEVSTPVHEEVTQSIDDTNGSIRPLPLLPLSPTILSSSSHLSPARSLGSLSPLTSPGSQPNVFGPFLLHYGSRGNKPGPLASSKQVKTQSHVSILSPKQRILAEKRASVLEEAAEWHEIMSHEIRISPQVLERRRPQEESTLSLSFSLPRSIDTESAPLEDFISFSDDGSDQRQSEPTATTTPNSGCFAPSNEHSETIAPLFRVADEQTNIPPPQSSPSGRRPDDHACSPAAQIYSRDSQPSQYCPDSATVLLSPSKSRSSVPGSESHLPFSPEEEAPASLLSSHLSRQQAEPATTTTVIHATAYSFSEETVSSHETTISLERYNTPAASRSATNNLEPRTSPVDPQAMVPSPRPFTSGDPQSFPAEKNMSQPVKASVYNLKSVRPTPFNHHLDQGVLDLFSPNCSSSHMETDTAETNPGRLMTDTNKVLNSKQGSLEGNVIEPAMIEHEGAAVRRSAFSARTLHPEQNRQHVYVEADISQPAQPSTFAPLYIMRSSPLSQITTETMKSPDPIANRLGTEVDVARAASAILATEIEETREKITSDENAGLTTSKELHGVRSGMSMSTLTNVPPQRHGHYTHVPKSSPFSARPSKEELTSFQNLPNQARTVSQLGPSKKQDFTLVKTINSHSRTKTLELLFESASGEMNLDTGYSFDVILNNTLSGFFSFYAIASGAPIDSFGRLRFTPLWPNCLTTRATKQMNEQAWRKLQKVIQASFKQAQRAEPEEMDFQIMVQME
ncbi:uncharacterized protein RAG0_02374 [Rhynchosporium agropyri]|uniref:Uncharacterized protein n=1 Tax=Rhynchosporium agropyri TaxID=914238 RepID=A0A1E1K1F3_9HELO|nr:uncharacterized protein RAG0_02374 [Rhynchosporium agropyri]